MKNTFPILVADRCVQPRLSEQEQSNANIVDNFAKLQVGLRALMNASSASLEVFFKPHIHQSAADRQQATMSLLVDFIEVIERLPDDYYYHPYIVIFIQCCRLSHLQRIGEVWRNVKRDSTAEAIVRWEKQILLTFTHTLKNVYAWCQTQEVRAKLRTIDYETSERLTEYGNYTDALFEAHDRLIVIRLDLFYQKHLSRHIPLHRLNDDLNRLVNNMRTNHLFDDAVGRIIKIEYGIEKGVHAHVTLFFNGSRRNPSSHIYLAQQIGDYWRQTATKDDGDYWNCNANIADFKRLGRCAVGLIHASDEVGRRNVREQIVKYACKPEQMIKVKSGNKVKTIRRGKMPGKREIKLGRPRQYEWCTL